MNVLFVGDILQLPPVNGAPVFDRITNKSVASKLGCMTFLQDTVVYDELTINERQEKDQVFSSMLDEVQHGGCPSQKTIQTLQARVITTPIVPGTASFQTVSTVPIPTNHPGISGNIPENRVSSRYPGNSL